MKRIYAISFISTIAVIIIAALFQFLVLDKRTQKHIKVGFVYVGDTSTVYTGNFVKAQNAIEKQYGDRVKTYAKYNVTEGNEGEILQELIDTGCELIFTTSYGFSEKTKEYAKRYRNVQFCQATGSNANEKPKLSNYHTFMGAVYQGRYVSGVAAGMKIKEMIKDKTITKEQAKIGYVGAYPYAEVISGYTAFLLGVRSVVPQAVMTVRYTNTWGSYALEKKCAMELIDEGCVIISQHSDTTGPAVACEAARGTKTTYHVAYNQSMEDVAPTTYLTGCRINWEPYILEAVSAVLSDKKIEDVVNANINGNDAGAGFERNWVSMLELNEIAVAKGTQERMEDAIKQLKTGKLAVFQGDYIGINPYDAKDTIDLNKGYQENKDSSAPTFHYVLKDVIQIE